MKNLLSFTLLRTGSAKGTAFKLPCSRAVVVLQDGLIADMVVRVKPKMREINCGRNKN